jgi:effector-binding domain-containing protein
VRSQAAADDVKLRLILCPDAVDMDTRLFTLTCLGLIIGLVLMPGPLRAQEAVPPAPSTSQPSPPAPPPAAAAARPTLVPDPGDPMNVDEVTLPGKPAVVLSGASTWDEGFANLKAAFWRIEEELKRAGTAPAGRPLTVFTDTDDLGFRYEAMIPIAEIPAGRATLTPEIRFGRTPEGKALRFVHKAPYEEIDSTYETITAYLDAKGLVVKDAFIEEYAGDLKESADPGEINVFVQPKE